MKRSVVVSVGLVVVASGSAAPRQDAPAATFDNASGLAAWQTALAAQREGKASHPLRISYIGDSLTADDHITNALRSRLAALVGDGGPGFVFAANPHPYCQHHAVTRRATGSWTVWGVSRTPASDHLLGLGGSAETAAGAVRMTLATPNARSIDIHYLLQPHGGTLRVVADGQELRTLETAGGHKQAAFLRVDLPEGTTRIDLRAAGRVRMFGAALEGTRGVVVDNLGIVNATAKQWATTNMPEHWQKQLAHRQSDLVVIMLGTNEAEWLAAEGAGMAEHERLFGQLLATVRAATPGGSCLVVSPLDQIDWRDTNEPRTSVPAMVAAQQRAALAHGCAFWNTYAWMGGKGASRTWRQQGLVIKDFQHPTDAGSQRIAAALFAGLTR